MLAGLRVLLNEGILPVSRAGWEQPARLQNYRKGEERGGCVVSRSKDRPAERKRATGGGRGRGNDRGSSTNEPKQR